MKLLSEILNIKKTKYFSADIFTFIFLEECNLALLVRIRLRRKLGDEDRTR
jgi:hypothetical protein